MSAVKKPVKMLKGNRAPSWAMYYGACASSGHDYQNREQDHGHVCSRWGKVSVTVLGPNLSREKQQVAAFHVHAAGCGDIKRFTASEQAQATELAADSRKEIVVAIYNPHDFGYDPDTELGSYEQDFYWAPCLRLK